MSLVSEALRKARLEAARQEARRRGAPPPPGPEPRPRRGPAAAWIVAAVVVALLAGGLLFWAGRRSAAPIAGEAPATPESQETLGTAVGKPAGAGRAADSADEALPVEPQPSEPSRTPPAAVESPERSEPAPTPPAPAPRGAPRADATPTQSSPAIPAQPAPTPRRDRETARSPRPPADSGARPVYVRSVEVTGGRLELGGIAFSEDRPFALINGEVVGPGDSLMGHSIIAVRPDSVEIDGPDGAFILRLR